MKNAKTYRIEGAYGICGGKWGSASNEIYTSIGQAMDAIWKLKVEDRRFETGRPYRVIQVAS